MKYTDDPEFDTDELFAKCEELKARFSSPGTLSGRVLFPLRRSPPLKIYKYTSSENAKLILRNLSLRYTQAEVLDDIFEEAPCHEEIRRMMPEFEDGPTIVVDVNDRLAQFDRVKEARAKMRRHCVVLSDDIAIITTWGIVRGWTYEGGNQRLKAILEKVKKPLALSLTESANNIKMWSGYADAHQGVCLGFSTRTKYFRSNRDLIGESGYFAPVEYRQLRLEDYAYRFPHERFFTKTEVWAEQREWRRVEFVVDDRTVDWKTAVYVFPFPPECLTSITFGARCGDESVGAITKIVRSQPSLSHVQFQKVKASLGLLDTEEV